MSFVIAFESTNLKRIAFTRPRSYGDTSNIKNCYVYTYGPWKHLTSKNANQEIYNSFLEDNFLGNNNSYRYGIYLRCSCLQSYNQVNMTDDSIVYLEKFSPMSVLLDGSGNPSVLFKSASFNTQVYTNTNFFYKENGVYKPNQANTRSNYVQFTYGIPEDILECPVANQSTIKNKPESFYQNLDLLARTQQSGDSQLLVSCMNCMSYWYREPNNPQVGPYVMHDEAPIAINQWTDYNNNIVTMDFDGYEKQVKGLVNSGYCEVNLFNLDLFKQMTQDDPYAYFSCGTLPNGYLVVNNRRSYSNGYIGFNTDVFITIENPE